MGKEGERAFKKTKSQTKTVHTHTHVHARMHADEENEFIYTDESGGGGSVRVIVYIQSGLFFFAWRISLFYFRCTVILFGLIFFGGISLRIANFNFLFGRFSLKTRLIIFGMRQHAVGSE